MRLSTALVALVVSLIVTVVLTGAFTSSRNTGSRSSEIRFSRASREGYSVDLVAREVRSYLESLSARLSSLSGVISIDRITSEVKNRVSPLVDYTRRVASSVEGVLKRIVETGRIDLRVSLSTGRAETEYTLALRVDLREGVVGRVLSTLRSALSRAIEMLVEAIRGLSEAITGAVLYASSAVVLSTRVASPTAVGEEKRPRQSTSSANEGAIVSFVVFLCYSIILNFNYYLNLITRTSIPLGEFYYLSLAIILICSLLLIVLGATLDAVGYRRNSITRRQVGLIYMALGLILVGLYTTVDFAVKYYTLNRITQLAGLVIIPIGYLAWMHFIVAYSHRILEEHGRLVTRR
jgi:hypothetical protein